MGKRDPSFIDQEARDHRADPVKLEVAILRAFNGFIIFSGQGFQIPFIDLDIDLCFQFDYFFLPFTGAWSIH